MSYSRPIPHLFHYCFVFVVEMVWSIALSPRLLWLRRLIVSHYHLACLGFLGLCVQWMVFVGTCVCTLQIAVCTLLAGTRTTQGGRNLLSSPPQQLSDLLQFSLRM